MSKLPIWLPPGFEGYGRRIPVLRVEGYEPGSPMADELAERFAGSLRQFYVGQARNHALGITDQTRTRVDRGDHQIEYMNQSGQEFVTLRVHPQLPLPKPEPEETFVPMEFLELRVRGEIVPGSGVSSAAYNAMFYVQGVYNAETAPSDTAIGSPYQLPAGVAVAGGGFFAAYDTHIFDAVSDPVVDNARIAWLDLRGFSPDAVVGVDIYIYHDSEGPAQEEIVGSEIAATAAWGSGGAPDAAPYAPGYIKRYHDATDWVASQSHIQSDFPEYADLTMTPDSSFGFSFLTSPLNKLGINKYGTYIGSTGGYLGSPPPWGAIDVARGGSPKALETWPGTNHPPYNVSYGQTEYYPGTGFPRKQPYYYYYNSYTADDTMLSQPPSSPSWNPAGGGNYTYSCEIGIGYVLYSTILELVTPPAPLQFDVWALGRMGGERARERLFPPPNPPEPPNIGENELPLVAQNQLVDGNLLTPEQVIAGFSVSNHFNGIRLGTVYADRKHHAVSWAPAP